MNRVAPTSPPRVGEQHHCLTCACRLGTQTGGAAVLPKLAYFAARCKLGSASLDAPARGEPAEQVSEPSKQFLALNLMTIFGIRGQGQR